MKGVELVSHIERLRSEDAMSTMPSVSVISTIPASVSTACVPTTDSGHSASDRIDDHGDVSKRDIW